MKRKKQNIIMVALIVVIMAAGCLMALSLREDTGSVSANGTTATIDGSAENEELVCTIEIRCDTVLDNLDLLDEAKADFIPPDGMILQKATIAFTEGETAFDILQRACEEAQLQLEYSWTPVYDSYYIEGINHLYEFDCGSRSGWMYQVNDTFPNYGCSGYTVQPGDAFVWCYTCQGLGTDVGGNVE